MHAICVWTWTSSRHVRLRACVSVCNLRMQMCSCNGGAHLYDAMRARGQDVDGMKDCHMCGNSATDHFYHFILWAQVCKCVTCLCFSGYAPVLAKRMMKWSQMGEKNKTASWRKKKGKRNGVGEKKKEKKNRYECQAKSQESAPSHTIAISIPQRRKRRERKVTLQWPWNYWFHRESLLEKQAQLLRALTSLGPDHCFSGLRLNSSCCLHTRVTVFAPACKKSLCTMCSAVSPRDVTTCVPETLIKRSCKTYFPTNPHT